MSSKIYSDKDKELLIRQLHEKILPVIKEFEDKIPDYGMATYLIHLAKEVMVHFEGDYYQILGLLTDLVNNDLKKMVFEAEELGGK